MQLGASLFRHRRTALAHQGGPSVFFVAPNLSGKLLSISPLSPTTNSPPPARITPASSDRVYRCRNSGEDYGGDALSCPHRRPTLLRGRPTVFFIAPPDRSADRSATTTAPGLT